MMKVIGVHLVEAPEPCFLLEVEFDQPAQEKYWSGVTQEVSGQPRENWQAVYDEQQLDDYGKRWVFFFHFLNYSIPLLTPDGPISFPALTPLPEYLQSIEYEEP